MKTKTPRVVKTRFEDESRIVIHSVCRDLLKIMARRKNQKMSHIVWQALTEHWLTSGYDPRLMFKVMDPPCFECGHQLHNPTEQDRQRLVEHLSGDGWEEREREYIAEQEKWDRLANEHGIEHPGDCKKRA